MLIEANAVYENLAESFAYQHLTSMSTVLANRTDAIVLCLYKLVVTRQLLWNLGRNGTGWEGKGKGDTGRGPQGTKSLNHKKAQRA